MSSFVFVLVFFFSHLVVYTCWKGRVCLVKGVFTFFHCGMRLTDDEIAELERNCVSLYYRSTCVKESSDCGMAATMASIACRSLYWALQALVVALFTVWWSAHLRKE
ncbi:hypothetical protein TcCL_NonESM02592 [Trypanosoma cruzi]|nr:hypothetical protein TcCL_NonESM02592 [Trypanosoma cruzi]